MAKGHSAVDLTDEDGGTRLNYTVQASVGGKLGQVGGRMIDAAAKQMADQFFTAFNAAVGEVAPATEAGPAAEAHPGPRRLRSLPRRSQSPCRRPLPRFRPRGSSGPRHLPRPPPSARASASCGSPSAPCPPGFGVWIASLLSR